MMHWALRVLLERERSDTQMSQHIILLPWSLYTDPWDTSCLKTMILTEGAWGKLQTCLWILLALSVQGRQNCFYTHQMSSVLQLSLRSCLLSSSGTLWENTYESSASSFWEHSCVEGWWCLYFTFWVEATGNLLCAEAPKSALCILTLRSLCNSSRSADCQIALLLTQL